LFSLAAMAFAASAQSLVKDIRLPSGGLSNAGRPQWFVDLGGLAVFQATNAFGRELWASDGTALGTRLIKDINPGAGDSYPENLTVANGVVFFNASVPGLGRELWRSDATAAGTFLLRDAAPGSSSGTFDLEIVAFGGHAWFASNDGQGRELWRSDGSIAGTARFADLNPGGGFSNPERFTVAAGALYFTAAVPGLGTELWRTDGTVAGTQLVADLNPGAGSTAFTALAGTPNGLFFAADAQNGTGTELWLLGPGPAGTAQLVIDLNPGTSGSVIEELAAFGNGVLFRADNGAGNGSEPWYSDGTTAGTVALGDLRIGSQSSIAAFFFPITPTRALFTAFSDATGRELYVTDGTAAGTQLLETNPGFLSGTPNLPYFAAINSGAMFVANLEVWFSDGTPGGTALVRDVFPGNPGSLPSSLTRVGNQVLFQASPSFAVSAELFRSDGTFAGTSLVADLFPPQGDSFPTGFTPAPNGVVFAADDGSGIELWSSDGTAAGTQMLDLGPGAAAPTGFVAFGNAIYCAATWSGLGQELLRTDGSLAGTAFVADLRPGTASSSPQALTSAAGRLWFTAIDDLGGREPWVSDGTVSGTLRLADVRPGITDSGAGLFTACGTNRVVFRAEDGSTGAELWSSDGTPGGTSLIDISVGAAGSAPDSFASIGNLTYFAATTPAAGRELWVTDGTAAGTQLVVDLRPGTAASNPFQLVALASGTLVFVAAGPSGGAEPHRSDGTAAGTALIGQVVPGSASGSIADMVAVGNLAFFTAVNPASGRELWVTDGLGVSLVKDIYPGEPNGVITGTLRRNGNGVAFVGSDGVDGLQIWTSDGTTNGTVQVGKIGPIGGAGAAEIGELTTIGTDTWFWADEGITGREPWRISITGVAASVSNYGLGCAGTGGIVPVIGANGLPRLGNTNWGFAVSNGLPFSIALLVAGFTPTNVPLGPCRINVAPPWFVQPTTFLDSSGAGLAPVPIPNTASLAGTLLYGQWVVIDPVAPLLGLGSSSGGLAAQIGN
jgi:ELWxxDGT repeat protein